MSIMAVRVGDFVKSTCENIPSGPFIEGSTNTFVNGRPQVRVGDKAVPGIAITGSRGRFVNGRPAVRRRDKVVCGIIMQSSRNTFIY